MLTRKQKTSQGKTNTKAEGFTSLQPTKKPQIRTGKLLGFMTKIMIYGGQLNDLDKSGYIFTIERNFIFYYSAGTNNLSNILGDIMSKGMIQEATDFWASYFGLDRKGKKTRKETIKLREAKKLERQARYGNKVGNKAVEIQRKKKRQMDRIQKGND